MKKLMPLMALPLLFLFGCDMDETTLTLDDTKQLDESSAYVFNINGDSQTWELVSDNESASTQNFQDLATRRSNNGNSVHAHGDYHAPNQFATVSFSATQNNGGAHGTAEFLQELPAFTLHLLMDTHCLIGDGDDAYYTGLITEVIESPFPFDLTGWYFRFGVRDNGEGANAPLDQYSNVLSFGPGPNCGILNGSFSDVGEASDKIKVNN